MKLKVFQIICVLIFFLSFGFLFGDRYWDFHDKIEEQAVFQNTAIAENKNFSVDEMEFNDQKMTLWETPSTEFLKKLVTEIDNASEKVLVEVYIFTERDLRDALIRAHERGVEVKIILENNPYRAPYLNDDHYELFLENGLDVKWSDPLNYSLNHAKLLIIDEKAYISTGNFSYSTFTKNRDLFIEIWEVEIVAKLDELFYLDFEHELWGVFHPQLIISPYSSRQKIETLIGWAEKSIDFYFPYMWDDGLEELFSSKVDEGITLRGIVSQNFWDDDSELLKVLEAGGWNISIMKKPSLHAKAILVDGKYLYVGSINFSTYSLDENREIGILITNQDTIQKFQNIFEWDFSFGKSE